jgi:hypothetical protein
VRAARAGLTGLLWSASADTLSAWPHVPRIEEQAPAPLQCSLNLEQVVAPHGRNLGGDA